MSSSNAILRIRGLSKRFGDFTALDNVDLEIAPGEIFALLGPNGAGKTTLIGCATGLARGFEGSIAVGGHDVIKDYKLARQLIGLVPQELNYDGFFTTRETLIYHASYFGVPFRSPVHEELLRDFSLLEKSEDNSRYLSGGMKRRLMICKALAHRPAVLFLDEPTAGVDVDLRDKLWDYIRDLRDAGVTIVLTTHYLEEAEQLADRIGVIDQGRLVEIDSNAGLREKYGASHHLLELSRPLAPSEAAELTAHEAIAEAQAKRVVMVTGATGGRRLSAVLDRIGELPDCQVAHIETVRRSIEDIFKGIVAENRATGNSAAPSKPEVTAPSVTPELQQKGLQKLDEVRARAQKNRGLYGTYGLFRREISRFLSMFMGSILSPVLTTVLWFLVFGYSLGDRLKEIEGIPYADFLVPGLIIMSVVMNAFMNSGFSFLLNKIHGSITDLLASPLSPLQITAAYIASASVRGLFIGSTIWLVAGLMGASTLANPPLTLLMIVLASASFGALGLCVGILATGFEQVNLLPNFIILPLTFLGGVFYSIKMLPDPWDTVALFNPLLYLVSELRYSMTGYADVPAGAGFVGGLAFLILGASTAYILLKTGYRVRD
jgi:ABC-type multidrug transport system ATPase subunit/ABC-type polysaccharide/polyol phosphate export permease